MDASTPALLRSDQTGITTLTLNRPEARNALSAGLIGALSAALDDAGRDPAIRAVVITAGGPVFSAGHDLKELTARRDDPDGGEACYSELFSSCSALMRRIVRLDKPVIAAVEGVATAAGCQLVASCDLAVAGADASFCTPGVHIGLFCSTPMVALSRNVGTKHAMEMLLLGEMIGAEDAWRMGLVNRVVPAGGVLVEALRLAGMVAAKSAYTVKVGKRAFYEQREMGLDEAYDYAGRVMVESMLSRDAEEGIGALLEKRQPVWAGA